MKTEFDKVFNISKVDVMHMRMPSPHEYSFFRSYFLSFCRTNKQERYIFSSLYSRGLIRTVYFLSVVMAGLT